MKVCTDSCIFGAWVKEPKAKNILDIGSGTGLLALMLAQKHHGEIDAVEIDENAYAQTVENCLNSPWKDLINVHNIDINRYFPPEGLLYALIVCNPPFFKNHLKSADPGKNQALHDTLLTLDQLVFNIKR